MKISRFWCFSSQVEAMHRIDEKLQKLDAHLECAGEERQSVEKEIKASI